MRSAVLAAALLWPAIAADKVPPGLAAKLGPPQSITLKRLSRADRPAQSSGGAMVAGMHRKLTDDTTKRGRWTRLPGGGNIWRLALKSPAATGIRVHFRDFAATGGNVWVYATAGAKPEIAGPYTGAGVNRDGDFWSDVVFADTIVVEYEPAPGARTTGAPPFRISEISHLW